MSSENPYLVLDSGSEDMYFKPRRRVLAWTAVAALVCAAIGTGLCWQEFLRIPPQRVGIYRVVDFLTCWNHPQD